MAVPTTAARDTASFDRHYATILEEWEDDFEEVIFEENVLLWILNMLSRHWKTGGRDVVLDYSSVKNGTAEFFGGTQKLQIEQQAGPSAAMWRMKNAKVSIMEIWEESIENSGPTAIADRFQEQIENAEGALAELLSDAAKVGQAGGANYFEGLQDAVYSTAQSTTAARLLTRGAGADAPFSAVNTYAGVNRVGTDTGATGWRNASADLSVAQSDTAFSSLTDEYYTSLRRMKNMVSRGAMGPDLILMSLKPYEDFESLHESNVRFEKGTSGPQGMANFPFETLKFGNCLVVKWEDALYDSATGADATADTDMIYILNTRFWRLTAETQAWFAWTDWVQSADVLARVAHLVVRMVPRCINPRWQAVLFDYGL